ncbi:MAG: hypothetical protein QM755_00610 [Luteolibacter sp.]
MRRSILLFLVWGASVISLRADVVHFGGVLYQQSGAMELKRGETLGAFVDRIGGIIRPEFERDGVRQANRFGIAVTRSGKRTMFYFGRDDAAAWKFALKPDDTIEAAEAATWGSDDYKKEELKLPPLKFTQPKEPASSGGK